METKHTAEPWAQGVTLRTNVTKNWTTEQVEASNAFERIKIFSNFSATDEGRSRVLVATCQREEDARRVVACVNACAGIDTKTLEATGGLNELYDEIQCERDQAAQQRDELLAALKMAREHLKLADALASENFYQELAEVDAAIAKAEAAK